MEDYLSYMMEQLQRLLDIDSPSLGRFTAADREGLEAFVRVLERTVFA